MADLNQDFFSTSSAEALNDLDVREFARATHIVSIWCSALDAPLNVRAYMDALIGLSDGEDTHEASDLNVAVFACSEEFIEADIKLEQGKQTKTIKALQARVRAMRSRLIAIQTRHEVTLIQVTPGDKIKGVQYPTRYDMILFSMMREVQSEIMRRAKSFNENPQQVLIEVAMRVLRKHKGAGIPAKLERRKRKPLTADAAENAARAWIERTFYLDSQAGVDAKYRAVRLSQVIDEALMNNRNAIGKERYD